MAITHPSPPRPDFSKLSVALYCIPDSAVHVRGFSDFDKMCSCPVWPYLRSSKACTNMCDHLCLWFLRLSAVSTFQFPTLPHASAALAISEVFVIIQYGPMYRAAKRAQTCVSSIDTSSLALSTALCFFPQHCRCKGLCDHQPCRAWDSSLVHSPAHCQCVRAIDRQRCITSGMGFGGMRGGKHSRHIPFPSHVAHSGHKLKSIVLIVRMRWVPFASFESLPLCSNSGAYFTRVFLQNKQHHVDNNNSIDTSVGL
jgi:hypothetical protein